MGIWGDGTSRVTLICFLTFIVLLVAVAVPLAIISF